MGVAERLAHEVEVQIVSVGTEFGQPFRKFLGIHGPGGALGTGAESAAEVAEIGNLQIDFSKAFHVNISLRISLMSV